jgi:hypothetical protein
MATPSRQKREDIVVFRIRRDSTCDGCSESLPRGSCLRKEGDRGLCLDCADLGDLVYLPSGDAAITRRASRYSTIRAVVVQWSRTRKRYERQGILVEEEALDRAEQESMEDAPARELRRQREAVRRERIDAGYIEDFAREIRKLYPSMPAGRERLIAEHACRKYSGRVGRSAAAKQFDPDMIELAVRAHIRHRESEYDELIATGWERHEARAIVRPTVDRIAASWR